jgi:hypothetical protein
MEAVRDQLLKLKQAMDEEEQAEVEEMLAFLTELVNSPDPDALIDRERDIINSDMLRILSANIKKAQQQGNTEAAEAMKRIFGKLAAVIEEQMPPEMRFLSRWLSADADEDGAFVKQSQQFDRDRLIQWCDVMLGGLQAAGQTEVVQRLQAIRAQL